MGKSPRFLLQKKRSDEQKPAEEKIKKLKKRNAELAAIARRLEEKAKQLQQENSKVTSRRHTPTHQKLPRGDGFIGC